MNMRNKHAIWSNDQRNVGHGFQFKHENMLGESRDYTHVVIQNPRGKDDEILWHFVID